MMKSSSLPTVVPSAAACALIVGKGEGPRTLLPEGQREPAPNALRAYLSGWPSADVSLTRASSLDRIVRRLTILPAILSHVQVAWCWAC
jgi:hypothetical protein